MIEQKGGGCLCSCIVEYDVMSFFVISVAWIRKLFLFEKKTNRQNGSIYSSFCVFVVALFRCCLDINIPHPPPSSIKILLTPKENCNSIDRSKITSNGNKSDTIRTPFLLFPFLSLLGVWPY